MKSPLGSLVCVLRGTAHIKNTPSAAAGDRKLLHAHHFSSLLAHWSNRSTTPPPPSPPVSPSSFTSRRRRGEKKPNKINAATTARTSLLGSALSSIIFAEGMWGGLATVCHIYCLGALLQLLLLLGIFGLSEYFFSSYCCTYFTLLRIRVSA